MSQFVLVHGAWQTAATWELLTPLLIAEGHAVSIPSLTGLENDSHRLTPSVNLETHITDVVGLLARGDLRDVILVGHSYAGMIVTAVAERASDRISRLIYADAFVPDDGQSAADLLPDPIVQMFRAQAEDGWLLRGGESQLDLWGLKPA